MRLLQIVTFLALVFGFSCVPYALMIHTHRIGAGGGFVVRLVMWCPAFAAFATCALYRIDLATLGWNWRPAKYEAYAYLLPLLYAFPVYLVCRVAVKGRLRPASFKTMPPCLLGCRTIPAWRFTCWRFHCWRRLA